MFKWNDSLTLRISKRHLRPSRPRCEWHWAEAWSSATTYTTARCGVGDTSSSSSGRPREPSVVPGVSCSLYGTGNPWCKLASRIRSCWDARREVLPSDPELQHGRTPIFFFRSEEEIKHWVREKVIVCHNGSSRCTTIIERDNKIDVGDLLM